MKDQLHNTTANQKVYVIKFKSHFIKKGIKFRDVLPYQMETCKKNYV
jgi:hypothetical protein